MEFKYFRMFAALVIHSIDPTNMPRNKWANIHVTVTDLPPIERHAPTAICDLSPTVPLQLLPRYPGHHCMYYVDYTYIWPRCIWCISHCWFLRAAFLCPSNQLHLWYYRIRKLMDHCWGWIPSELVALSGCEIYLSTTIIVSSVDVLIK